MKKKKIIALVREFNTCYRSVDVDSRMYDGDTEGPIIGKTAPNSEGKTIDYHLGQISSNLSWAVQDIQNHFKKELDEMFPQGYTFEFYYLTLDFIKAESKNWWDLLNEDDKIWAMLVHGYEKRNPEKAKQEDIEEMWISQKMKETASTKLEKVNLKQIV